ncbi:hypothetical protein G9A89_016823 [Geosiphon pyriformis]|nr:hypothetical protein G9A89_016823 [Geosiphon pyriformis]
MNTLIISHPSKKPCTSWAVLNNITKYDYTSENKEHKQYIPRPDKYECDFHPGYDKLFYVILIYTIIILMTSLCFLYVRNYKLKHPWLFPKSRARGLIRIRPQEAFHIFCSLFCLSKSFETDVHNVLLGIKLKDFLITKATITDIVVVLNSSYSNMGYIMVHSLNTIDDEHFSKVSCLHNKHVIDGIGIFLFIGPIISILPVSYLKGSYLSKNDEDSARNIERLLTIVVGSIAFLFLSELLSNCLVISLGKKAWILRSSLFFDIFDTFAVPIFSQIGQITIIYNGLKYHKLPYACKLSFSFKKQPTCSLKNQPINGNMKEQDNLNSPMTASQLENTYTLILATSAQPGLHNILLKNTENSSPITPDFRSTLGIDENSFTSLLSTNPIHQSQDLNLGAWLKKYLRKTQNETITYQIALVVDLKQITGIQKNKHTLSNASDRIVLNVGGVKYETYRSTLTAYPDTLLGTMFQNRNSELLNLTNGNEYFIDRSGHLFHFIMQFYRTGCLVWPKEGSSMMPIDRRELSEELDYFLIPRIHPFDERIGREINNFTESLIDALLSVLWAKQPNSGEFIEINFTFKILQYSSVSFFSKDDSLSYDRLRSFLKSDRNNTIYMFKQFGEEIGNRLERDIPGFSWTLEELEETQNWIHQKGIQGNVRMVYIMERQAIRHLVA